MKKTICFVLVVFILFFLHDEKLSAQNADLKWGIGFHGSLIEPKTSLGDDFFSFDLNKVSFGQGLSLSRYINPTFDLGLYLSSGRMAQSLGVYHLNNLFYVTDLKLRFKFYNGYIIKQNAFAGPFISAGIGADFADVNAYGESEGDINKIISQMDLYAGAGIRFRLSELLSLELQSGIHLPSDNTWDANKNGAKDQFLEHSLGLIINLGKSKDSDKDGIADSKDKCPNTPTGVDVDEDGCPLDDDKDGIANFLDECPNEFGTLPLKGCPDKDGDGLADHKDSCPDLAGLINLNGCPDTDGDGIADPEDKCPGTQSGYKVSSSGCPFDTDGDGIVNEDDSCPDVFGLVSLKGCPDKDADGIADKDDKCPDMAGLPANNGCPDLPSEVSKQITNIANKIFFESGSTDLMRSSKSQLETLVDIMKTYPETDLSIEGYTDNTGESAQNMLLSQDRCESVKKYLISKGIDSSRLTAAGFGEAQPIGDNNTVSGRAKNRRVELKTKY